MTDRPHAHPTVLLVHDNPSVRVLMRDGLQGQVLNILDAYDALDALEVSARHEGPIDLVVAPTRMPGLSGYALAERLTARRPQMRVLLLAADVEVMRAVSLPWRFLSQPFTPRLFAARVGEVLFSAPTTPEPRR